MAVFSIKALECITSNNLWHSIYHSVCIWTFPAKWYKKFLILKLSYARENHVAKAGEKLLDTYLASSFHCWCYRMNNIREFLFYLMAFGVSNTLVTTVVMFYLLSVILFLVLLQHHTESASPTVLSPSALPLDLLNNAVASFSTVEELYRYLEPDRWQLDLEDLYRPTWQLLGKAYIHGRKSRGKELVYQLILTHEC